MFVLRFICTIYTLSFSLFFFLYCMYFEEATLSDCDILLFEKAVKSLTFIKLYYLRKYIFKKNSLAARSINDNCDFRPYDSTIFVHTIQPFSSIRFNHFRPYDLQSQTCREEKVVFFHTVAAGQMHLSLVKSKWAPHVPVLKTKTIIDSVDVYFCLTCRYRMENYEQNMKRVAFNQKKNP